MKVIAVDSHGELQIILALWLSMNEIHIKKKKRKYAQKYLFEF